MQNLEMHPRDRKAALQELQHNKMAESAHAYVRGNTARFYEWLKSDAVKASLPSGPDVWICGDCHTGNLGPVADLAGEIDIQIRDLDQTVIGNPAHDLVRLGLSLAMAARSSDLPGVTTAWMLEEVITGYLGLRGRTERTLPFEIEPIRRIMRQARGRRWKHLAEERIADIKPSIPLGRKFWPLKPEERKQIEQLFRQGTIRELLERVQGKPPKRLKLVDAAYWMKGCSSLGLLRYAVLVGVERKHDQRYHLLDIKQAVQAIAPSTRPSDTPSNDADRIVAGAKSLSPFLGNRMASVTLAGRNAFVRELRPQDMKFELIGLKRDEAIGIARLMGGVVGRAHGRQMTRSDKSNWSKDLKSRHSKGLDAPRWLWSSVLELAALHEAAYLEHCRRYALGSAS